MYISLIMRLPTVVVTCQQVEVTPGLAVPPRDDNLILRLGRRRCRGTRRAAWKRWRRGDRSQTRRTVPGPSCETSQTQTSKAFSNHGFGRDLCEIDGPVEGVDLLQDRKNRPGFRRVEADQAKPLSSQDSQVRSARISYLHVFEMHILFRLAL